MLIGELSKQAGLSRDTIRFYEKQGLIAVGRKERRFNNYKEYSEDTLQRLLHIKRIKGFGFTLNETAHFLDMIERKQATCGDVSEKISEKVSLIERKIADLEFIKKSMINGVDKCLEKCRPDTAECNCPMLVSDLI
ncbi:Mercuric resistance operon regulatory protein [Dyadobacter sp. CECT 9623]|uniref:Mercuric resistance operon regulatory protein n=1 Tax=Dyadobacter linearis TaxID=2823330 RepID=A0ABM8UY85_9BACT|nr:MerR family transcriptional regulator [Dyadobacter sp. CECT 9623]CAG5074587.1 Mercuric resistance operon regulatory protein [Dyadobacter sp. CECT 9623]